MRVTPAIGPGFATSIPFAASTACFASNGDWIRGVFDIDHFLPVVNHPDLAVDYDNLLYACTSCNLAKRDQIIPDPLIVLTSANVQVSEDRRLHTENAAAACLIEILGLDADDAVEFRMTWIGIVALAANCDPDLHRQLMGLPADLPQSSAAETARRQHAH